MDEKAILHRLKGIPFFSDFSPEELRTLASDQKYILNFENEQLIVEEGRIDKALYVLLKGKVRVTKKSKDKDITLSHLNQGAICGAMFLISKKERSTQYSLISEGGTTLIGLPPDYFKTLDPGLQIKLKEQLMEVVFTRFENLATKHADLMKDMLF